MGTRTFEILHQTSAGTPMGELLRRYWWPIAASAELNEGAPKLVKLLGEELVAYRDKSGTTGLVQRRCPHRGLSLEFGLLERNGIRCPYHGWLFDEKGQCLEQPCEDYLRENGAFRENARLKAYPVREKAGLLWAYLGPSPAPCLMDWDLYSRRGFKQITFNRIGCNWLQCQENAVDPYHFFYLHPYWASYLKGQRLPTDAWTSMARGNLRVEEFEWGQQVFVLRDGKSEWEAGSIALWPNCFYLTMFEFSVPMDDETNLRIRWSNSALPGQEPFFQEQIPYWYAEDNLDPREGILRGTMSPYQDFAAFEGQGAIADRSNERLGRIDLGIVKLRKRFLRDLSKLENDEDPFAILRDEARNHRIQLPATIPDQSSLGFGGRPPGGILEGQPPEIIEELARVWVELGGELDEVAKARLKVAREAARGR